MCKKCKTTVTYMYNHGSYVYFTSNSAEIK